MLQDLTNYYQKYMVQIVNAIQPFWFEYLRSDGFSKWTSLMRTYFIEMKEKMNHMMELYLDNYRIASKEDIDDLIDSQRVVLDMLEEVTDKLEKLEDKVSKKGGK